MIDAYVFTDTGTFATTTVGVPPGLAIEQATGAGLNIASEEVVPLSLVVGNNFSFIPRLKFPGLPSAWELKSFNLQGLRARAEYILFNSAIKRI